MPPARRPAAPGSSGRANTPHPVTRARVARVSEDFWDIARPALALGRLPGSGETNAIVLSYRLFEERFRDPSIVGRSATFDGAHVTVVGILQRAFRFELVPPPRRDVDVAEVEAYVPLEAAPQDMARSRGRTVNVVAKVKPLAIHLRSCRQSGG